jgi:hypothetical protein
VGLIHIYHTSYVGLMGLILTSVLHQDCRYAGLHLRQRQRGRVENALCGVVLRGVSLGVGVDGAVL